MQPHDFPYKAGRSSNVCLVYVRRVATYGGARHDVRAKSRQRPGEGEGWLIAHLEGERVVNHASNELTEGLERSRRYHMELCNGAACC